MTKDYIVEEVRRVREQQAARHDFDISAILADARKRQRRSSHRVVSFVGKKKRASGRLIRCPRRPATADA